MKFEILEEKKNPLMKRKEILVSIDFEGSCTPSKFDLQKAIAESMKANAENIEVSKVLSEIGLSRGKAWVKVWEEKSGFDYAKKEKPKEEKPEVKEVKPEPEEVKEEKVEEPKEETEPEVKEEQ